MSSLRLVVSPLIKDTTNSGSINLITRCAWLGVSKSCHKRPLSGNTRATVIHRTARQTTSAQLLTMDSRNMSSQPAPCGKCVTYDNMNPAIKVMEYAVRGPLVIRASEIEKELEKVSLILG